jgi:hypothetical protein
MSWVGTEYPVVTFAEIESLIRLAGPSPTCERLPFLPQQPHAEVFAAGVASLIARGYIGGTTDAPQWSAAAAAVGRTIADIAGWVELEVPTSRGSSYFGASADGSQRVLLGLVAFGAFQMAPVRIVGTPADSLVAILLAIARSSESGVIASRAGGRLMVRVDAAGRLQLSVDDEPPTVVTEAEVLASAAGLISRQKGDS